MALDTNLKDYADAIKAIIELIKTDLEIAADHIYIFEVPQNFQMPAAFIELQGANLVRMNTGEAQYQVTYSLTFFGRDWKQSTRVESSYKKLSTIMRHFMKNPTLGNKVIDLEVSEGRVGVMGLPGRDQVYEGFSLLIKVFEEPISLT